MYLCIQHLPCLQSHQDMYMYNFLECWYSQNCQHTCFPQNTHWYLWWRSTEINLKLILYLSLQKSNLHMKYHCQWNLVYRCIRMNHWCWCNHFLRHSHAAQIYIHSHLKYSNEIEIQIQMDMKISKLDILFHINQSPTNTSVFYKVHTRVWYNYRVQLK